MQLPLACSPEIRMNHDEKVSGAGGVAMHQDKRGYIKIPGNGMQTPLLLFFCSTTTAF